MILDTDVIIRSEKGAFDLKTWLATWPDGQFEIAAITVAELWHGVEWAVGPRRARRRQYLEVFLTSLPIIPYTEETAFAHARIWADLEASGKMIGYYELIVAATALQRGSEVVTFNKRHFSQVKGLTVIELK